LEKVLKAKGFSTRWIVWIKKAVLQGSSQVLLNSVAGRKIWLRRGVRQGDPLSPYLFILAADFLPKWIEYLTSQHIILKPFPQCHQCLLYADDTLFIIKPEEQQINALKIILQVYGQISGLEVCMDKSELMITSSQQERVQQLAAIMGCKAGSFPIKYLGLPLSNRKLAKEHFRELIHRVQNKLANWKASLLSSGGRLTLINSALTPMLIFFMSTFLLPIWVIKEIDKIRRRFLWHGQKEQTTARYMSLVNWKIVTTPKNMGGLGIVDIQIMNQTLLTKIIWKWIKEETWFIQDLYMDASTIRPWLMTQATPFWKSLQKLDDFVNVSMQMDIKNEKMMRFWLDNWKGDILQWEYGVLFTFVQDINISVADSWQNNN
jgi:Reverse transcriptase (RNA-dependent DNA polymerase)